MGWVQVVSQYGSAELVWCQEEPKNMGAYRYIQPRLATAMRELSMAAFGAPPRALHYIGRPAAASAGARRVLSCLGMPEAVPLHDAPWQDTRRVHLTCHAAMWALQPPRPMPYTWRRPRRSWMLPCEAGA